MDFNTNHALAVQATSQSPLPTDNIGLTKREFDKYLGENKKPDIYVNRDKDPNYRDIGATIKVGAPGKIMIINKKGDVVKETNEFFMQAIGQPKSEKVQLAETFIEGNPSIFFFGKRTPTYSFTGKVLNTFSADTDYNWTQRFQYLWDNYLRGTKLVESDNIATMLIDDEMLQGYPVSFTIQKTSSDGVADMFSMSWIIINHVQLTKISELDSFVRTMAPASIKDFFFFSVLTEFKKNILDYPDTTSLEDYVDIKIEGFSGKSVVDPTSGKNLEMTYKNDDGELEFTEGVIEVFTNISLPNQVIKLEVFKDLFDSKKGRIGLQSNEEKMNVNILEDAISYYYNKIRDSYQRIGN